MKFIVFVLCAFVFSSFVLSDDTCVATAKCKPNPPYYDLPLNADGKYFLSISDIDDGSFTTCPGTLNLRLANAPAGNTLICNTSNKVPNYNITLGLVASADGAQNSICLTQFHVVDHIPPTAICKNITVGSDAVIDGLSIDNGSFDNCNIQFRRVSQSSFGGCSDVVVVTLTVIDYAGNQATCTSTVTVTDTNPPVASCQDSVQNVGESGSITILPSQGSIVDAGSIDECDGTFLNEEFTFTDPITKDCSTLGTVPVTLLVSDQSGNSDTCGANLIFVDNTPPVAVCTPEIFIDVGVNGSYIVTATDVAGDSYDTCGIASYGNNFEYTCNYISYFGGDYTAYAYAEVIDTSNNADYCYTVVIVEDNTPPVAICIEPSFTFNVGSGNYSLSPYSISAGSYDVCTPQYYLSYGLSKTDYSCSDIGTQTVVLNIQDRSSNLDTCTATLIIEDTTDPVAQCVPPFTVNVGLTGNYFVNQSNGDFINGNSSDFCSPVTTTLAQVDQYFDCLTLGSKNFTLLATDASGNTANCTTLVTFADQTAPTPVCVPSVNLQIGDGEVHVVSSATLMAGTTDACGVTYSAAHTFSCSSTGVGVFNTTSVATDPSGNKATCNTTVNAYDTVVPNALCKVNPTLNVGATGTATALTSTLNDGSFDACSTVTLKVSNSTKSTFTCADLDTVNGVDLIATDGSNNQDTCTASLRVVDTTSPTPLCKAYTADVGAAPGGIITITTNQGFVVNNGSTDVCTPASQLTFTLPNDITGSCSTLGSRGTTLTVTDLSGNSATCSGSVVFADLTPPTVACVPFYNLNVGSGPASPPLTSIATAFDTCGGLSYNSSSKTVFTCLDLGNSSYPVIVKDASNNTASCNTTLFVVDTTSPIAKCAATYTVAVGTGTGNITASNINSGTSDFCDAAPTVSISPSNFTCADLGVRHVTLTATDASGNIDTCITPVSVVDTTIPVASCKNSFIEIGYTGYETIPTTATYLIDNGSSDVCSDISLLLNATFTGDCSTLGPQSATLNVADASGNVANCTGNLIFRDTVPPVVTCRLQVTYEIGSNLEVFDPYSGFLAVDDVCSYNATASVTNLLCPANLGSKIVLVTATDSSGNSASCNTTLISYDGTGPVATCVASQNQDVGNGTVTLNGTVIGAGTIDACGGAITYSLNRTQVTCADVGNNVTVELTAYDQFGNPSTCNSIIKVVDTVNPVAVCVNVTRYLDSTGKASVTAADLDGGSHDTCSTVSLSIASGALTCTNVGSNSIILTVTDASGNSATCTSTVTVIDAILPTAKCNSALFLTNNPSITAATINGGSYDNCPGYNSVVTGATTFSNNIGGNTVLTVTDAAGNINTCVSTVTIDIYANLVISPLSISEHIPFTISWIADVNVPNTELVTLALINPENSFVDIIGTNVPFGRLQYVVAGGVSGVTADKYYLVAMYRAGSTSIYKAHSVYIQHFPTSD